MRQGSSSEDQGKRNRARRRRFFAGVALALAPGLSIPAADDRPSAVAVPGLVANGAATNQAQACLDLGQGVQLELAKIPAGRFIMGSSTGEADETPHPVHIVKDFWIGKYEVSNAQYQRFLDDSGYAGETEADKDYLGHFKGTVKYASPAPDFPVVCVSWKNAQAFCAWLTKKSGRQVRLPTEAEWEYACRAGVRTEFYSGDGDAALQQAGWYSHNSGGKTHPRGQLQANAWNLFDVHGNVWEWCEDWYAQDYYLHSPPDDPPGPATGATRVQRGGSWFLAGRYCRAANRDSNSPESTNYVIGFRIVVQ